MEYEHYHAGKFSIGLLWGTLLSVPLWISFLGWVKLTYYFLNS